MRIAKPTEVSAAEHPLLNEGVIQLTVHDGKLMQVDVTERRRFGN